MAANVVLEARPRGPAALAARPRAGTVLSAWFLGSFRATLDHRPVALRSRRTRVLLAYLVDRSQVPVPRDVLMDAFWPRSTPAAARNSLHVAMWALRRDLAAAWPGSVVECRGDVYRFSDEVVLRTDVAEMAQRCDRGAAAAAAGRLTEAVEEYEAARALCRGAYLADDPYLEWALQRRDDLRLRALGCAERLSELYLELGDLRETEALCTHVLREEPCHEPVARRLMLAYARLGQPHMALREYDRIVHELDRDLGVQAATETVALAEAIRGRLTV
jgi:DNA-binding SARP family transcriptional activator